MAELKAYACLEPYESTGAIFFAKSDIEARRNSADEFNDGDITGMSVKRAPWADKYGSGSKIPISDMVDHGWHFECHYSGVTIDSDLYYEGHEIYNDETEEYEYDETCKGKEPVGFQYGPVFACQEYADKFSEDERKRKEFEANWLKFWRDYVLKKLPDAIIINRERYGQSEHIYSVKVPNTDMRTVEQVTIAFEFPGMKYNACLEFRRGTYNYSESGPPCPHFVCANGDREEFEKWVETQKIIRRALSADSGSLTMKY